MIVGFDGFFAAIYAIEDEALAYDGAGDFFNRRWRDYTGLSTDASRTRGWRSVIHPDDVAEAHRVHSKLLADTDAVTLSFRARRREGGLRIVVQAALRGTVPGRNEAREPAVP